MKYYNPHDWDDDWYFDEDDEDDWEDEIYND